MSWNTEATSSLSDTDPVCPTYVPLCTIGVERAGERRVMEAMFPL